MTDIVPALIEGVKIVANVQKDKNYYDYLASTRGGKREIETPRREELTLPGVELENYTKRVPVDSNEDYVRVTDHKEYLEKKYVPPSPPTAEEIAEERAHKRFIAKVWGGVASVAIVVGGVVMIVHSKKHDEPRPIEIESV